MARLQILELPEVFVGEASETPFVLVVDEMPTDEAAFDALRRDLNNLNADVAKRIGARAVLCFETTVDIPANDTTAYLPATEQESGDQGHETRDEDADTRDAAKFYGAKLAHLGGLLDEARSWARHGYEIGQKHCGWSDHGVAPGWLTEGWPPHIDSCERLKHAAALDEALSSIRSVHAPVEHRGQMICKECSGLDPEGGSTDNAPVLHEQCRTSRIAFTAQSADA